MRDKARRPRTSVAVVLAAVAASLTLGSGPVTAQPQQPAAVCDGLPPIEPQYQARLAHHFAPIYWFAPDERYFPTLPLFSAFDGVDNDGDGRRDFDDPDEILPLVGGRPDWGTLNEWYVRARDEGTDRPAIFYRARDLRPQHIDELFRYLKSDEQAWKRLGEREDQAQLLADVRDDATGWVSVEFYAYYVNDWGLEGHPYDVEFAIVFLPCRREAGSVSYDLAGRFRVFVGPGHTDRVPSNVLLVNGGLAGREVTIWPASEFCGAAPEACAVDSAIELHFERARPSQILSRPEGVLIRRAPTVLVELGDHSSSPDIDPFGLFHPGHDANWHINDLWGTRDVQATSALGFLGRYQGWMTLPRTEQNSVVFYPYFTDRQEVLEQMTSQKGPEDPGPQVGGRTAALVDSIPTREYALLPADAFGQMFALAAEAEPGSVDEVVRLLRAQSRAIREQRLQDWEQGFDVPARLSADAMARLRRWGDDMRSPRGSIRASSAQPWASPHYRGPSTRVFKTELFRPVWEGPGTLPALLNFWYTFHGDRAGMIQAGLVIPALEALPVRFSGFAELRAGLYCGNQFCAGRDRQSFTASLVHTNHYNAGVTWYAKLLWVADKRRVDDDPGISRWLMGGGVSLTPASLIASRRGVMGFLRRLTGWSRLQVGLATDLTVAEVEFTVAPLDPPLRRPLRR